MFDRYDSLAIRKRVYPRRVQENKSVYRLICDDVVVGWVYMVEKNKRQVWCACLWDEDEKSLYAASSDHRARGDAMHWVYRTIRLPN